MSIDHELKTQVCYYRQILAGNKTFEIRYNGDRSFQKGDIVRLMEFKGDLDTGASIDVKITYVTSFNQVPDWVVFSFEKVAQ